MLSGGVAHVSCVIEDDLLERETGLQKPHVCGLADLAASVLSCRNVNSSEWAAIMPRGECDAASKERYIRRFLSNRMIDPIGVMQGFIPEIVEMICAGGKIAVLMLDQSKIADGFECLMISLRVADRAIPVAWRVIETEGAIGFDVQEPLLDRAAKMLPEGAVIMLAADRFYGTQALIGWCQKQGWQYRIRLKGNLTLIHEDSEITTGEAVKLGLASLENAAMGKIKTHIGILHEKAIKSLGSLQWIVSRPSTKPSITECGGVLKPCSVILNPGDLA